MRISVISKLNGIAGVILVGSYFIRIILNIKSSFPNEILLFGLISVGYYLRALDAFWGRNKEIKNEERF